LTEKIFIFHSELMTELIVILKTEDRTYRQKFVIYEKYAVSVDDSVILACIAEAKKNLEGKPESIQVKIHLDVQ
jgi:hypothetical protein